MEVKVRHIPPTQAVELANVVVSPVRSSGLEPPMQTPSSSRQVSVASTLAQAWHSRSRSRAPGLLNLICQILHAELRRGVRSCMLNFGGAGIVAVARRATVICVAPVEGRTTPSPPLGLITVSPPAGTLGMHIPAVRPVVSSVSLSLPSSAYTSSSLLP